MSSKAQNARKAKTASGLKRFINLSYLAAGLLLLFSLLFMPSLPASNGPYRKACFDNNKCLRLEDAITPQQLERGLSGRYKLPTGTAMIFVFDQPSNQCMWMKQMRFSLDMVWLAQDKKIHKIIKNLSPDTYPESFCADNTKYVLELNPDTVEKLGLNIGDLMQL